MRHAPSLLLVASLIAVGCGDRPERDPASTPEQRIADRVADFWEDVEQGDGEAACAAVTERGRRLFIRWSADAPRGREAASCPEAVSALADAIEDGRGVTGEGGSFSADDVSIDGDEAEVQCRYRGAIFLARVGGEWLVTIPACYD